MKAGFRKFTLTFKKPMGTSRGPLSQRDTYVLSVSDGITSGYGECAPVPGLSVENCSLIEKKLRDVCNQINNGFEPNEIDLAAWPSIKFALETALLDFTNGGKQLFFDTGFTRGEDSIPTNGLIVMGSPADMLAQVRQKVTDGFNCIKIKIGALDFETECALLSEFREKYPADKVELRLDANGAFAPGAALDRLSVLSQFSVHSVEQPVKPGQWEAMAKICKQSPIAIALDEELIGITSLAQKLELLEAIQPQLIIIKPTLLGGIQASEEFIRIAQKLNIGYWITSILESNIGLNLLCQWTGTLNLTMAHGLGTGQLFTQNFPSSLTLRQGCLKFVSSDKPRLAKSISDLKISSR